MRAGAGDRVEHLLHRGADAVLGRSAPRRLTHGLGGTREVDEVSALSVVELQRARQRLEHAGGCSGEVAALQACVVGDAHAGEDGDLFASQSGHAAGAVIGQADVGGVELGSAGGQEIADLVARVHRHQDKAAHRALGDPGRVTFTGFPRPRGPVLGWSA
jgi:hypothetical protein